MSKIDAQLILDQLQSLGTEQNRKIYKRHGAQEPLFGVSFANLNKLKKTIKIDHAIALALWDTRNYDAMILATMIADPQKSTNEMLQQWTKGIYCPAIADLFSAYVYKTSFAESCMKTWIASENEWLARAGWDLLARFAMYDKSLSNNFFVNYLNQIQSTIHQEKNFTKHAMNNALIAIGLRNDHLKELALIAAKSIGKVEVDHKETNCKTPDATSYILKGKPRHGTC